LEDAARAAEEAALPKQQQKKKLWRARRRKTRCRLKRRQMRPNEVAAADAESSEEVQ
jgi:hypothetical protein